MDIYNNQYPSRPRSYPVEPFRKFGRKSMLKTKATCRTETVVFMFCFLYVFQLLVVTMAGSCTESVPGGRMSGKRVSGTLKMFLMVFVSRKYTFHLRTSLIFLTTTETINTCCTGLYLAQHIYDYNNIPHTMHFHIGHTALNACHTQVLYKWVGFP